MTNPSQIVDASCGELRVHTGVSGRAARLGHRLTIAVNSWSAVVSWADGEPTGVDFAADVDSLEVLGGEGGVKALSTPEKAIARSNALRSLDAKRFPRITFVTSEIDRSERGYQLTGELSIHGKVRTQVVDLLVEDHGDTWEMSCENVIRQSDFGIKPFSLMLGALAVADDVRLSFTAHLLKN